MSIIIFLLRWCMSYQLCNVSNITVTVVYQNSFMNQCAYLNASWFQRLHIDDIKLFFHFFLTFWTCRWHLPVPWKLLHIMVMLLRISSIYCRIVWMAALTRSLTHDVIWEQHILQVVTGRYFSYMWMFSSDRWFQIIFIRIILTGVGVLSYPTNSGIV